VSHTAVVDALAAAGQSNDTEIIAKTIAEYKNFLILRVSLLVGLCLTGQLYHFFMFLIKQT
jgi:hypothetical protein